jgi:hypothetical protein
VLSETLSVTLSVTLKSGKPRKSPHLPAAYRRWTAPASLEPVAPYGRGG